MSCYLGGGGIRAGGITLPRLWFEKRAMYSIFCMARGHTKYARLYIIVHTSGKTDLFAVEIRRDPSARNGQRTTENTRSKEDKSYLRRRGRKRYLLNNESLGYFHRREKNLRESGYHRIITQCTSLFCARIMPRWYNQSSYTRAIRNNKRSYGIES